MSNPTPASTPAHAEPPAPPSSFLSELRSTDRSADAPVISAPKRKRIPLHLIVAAAVVLLGGVSLMGMRKIGMKAGMTFETDASLLPVDSPSGKDNQRLAAVMADLELSQSPGAFAHTRPEKNPFSFTSGAPKKTDDPKDDSKELAQRQAEALRLHQEQVESAVASLRLNGIVGARGAYIASIGDKTFRVGDIVQDLFTITDIDGRTVTVAVDDQLYELTIGQQAAKAVAKKPGAKPAAAPAAKPSKPAKSGK